MRQRQLNRRGNPTTLFFHPKELTPQKKEPVQVSGGIPIQRGPEVYASHDELDENIQEARDNLQNYKMGVQVSEWVLASVVIVCLLTGHTFLGVGLLLFCLLPIVAGGKVGIQVRQALLTQQENAKRQQDILGELRKAGRTTHEA